MKNKLFMLLVPCLLNACVEFQHAPCDVGTLTEYPTFESSRTLRIYDSGEMRIISGEDRLTKTGTATYKDGDGEQIRTCKISGRDFAEHFSEKNQSYELSLLEFMPDESVLMSAMMVNKDRLDSLEILNTIVTRKQGSFGFEKLAQQIGAWQDNSSTKALLILESDPVKRLRAVEELVPAAILVRSFKQ